MKAASPLRWTLILHGKAAGDEPLREAVARMRERGVSLDVRVTWEAGDAERYVTEALASGVDTLIAAGGDGTLSEVATTLAHRGESADALPTLGLVPFGTANDFACAAHVPLQPLHALEAILAQPAQPIDLLRIRTDGIGDSCRDHWCANLASGGFGTEVTVETSEGLKSLLGGLAYVLTGLAKLGRIDPIQARITGPGFDGAHTARPGFGWEGGFIALGVGNGRQAGGGQALCPDALLDDGLLDVTIVPDMAGEVAATLGTIVTDGKQAALDRVATRVRLPWVEIETSQPLILNLDGEPVESRHFRIDCVPARLRMHLPPDCPLLRRAATVAA